MENLNSTDNQNILEELDSKSANSTLHFKNSLRNRVISSFEEEQVEGKFFFSERTVNYLSIFIVILSIGIVTGAGIISFNNGNSVVNIDSVAAVPANKKPEILEAIIKNNPDALILQTAAVVSEDPSDIAAIAETAQQVSVSPEVKGYNFSFTKASSEFGTNITCSNDFSVKEIYNYSEDNLNLYRVVNLNSKEDIIDSVQVETTNGVATSKYSREGDEQIIFSSNNLETVAAPTSFPVSSPQVTSNNIDKYFDGSNQNLTEVTRDGFNYYVLETTGNYNCNGIIVNAVFKKWFDRKDFSLLKKEIYKTNSIEENLIERTTYNVANQQVDYESISNNFLKSDPENTIDITLNSSLQTLQQFLNNSLEIIPGDSSINNLYISSFQNLASMNKLFYSDDLSYNKKVNELPISYLDYTLRDTQVSVFNDDVENNSLFFNIGEGISQNIRVGDEFYTGELFTGQLNQLPVSFAKENKVKQIFVVEIKGLKYVFSSTSLDSIINNGLDSLSLLDTFNADKV